LRSLDIGWSARVGMKVARGDGHVRAHRTRAGEARKSAAHFLAGGTAAGLVRAGLQPLDTCKTRLQAHISNGAVVAPFSKTARAEMLRVILGKTGIRGLYRGVVPGIVGIVPAAAVYMLVYQTLKRRATSRIPTERRALRGAAIMMSAAIGDAAACAVRVPLELVKQRLQVGIYASVRQAVAELAKLKSPALLYTGMRAQLARDIPFAMTEFLAYETLKEIDSKRSAKRAADGKVARYHDKQRQLLIGGICGALAAIVSNPMDVVKTRLMTQAPAGSDLLAAALNRPSLSSTSLSAIQSAAEVFSFSKGASSHAIAVGSMPSSSTMSFTAAPRAAASVAMASQLGAHAGQRRYYGVLHCFTTILRTEGVPAFAKGLVPRIAAKTLQSALFFAAYEALHVAYAKVLSVDVQSGDESGVH